MGVPKFYRWISERYPTLSEVISDSQIPEFDNLYLDMNGIIHQCSHPNDDDVTFRITEEAIFQDIFDYIEKLFMIVRPNKVFFMAVDGVAPRAKMNQQRARRFMSARTAQEQMEKAIKKGEELPDEKRFDSNCITPGTPFMTRLHAQLNAFVSRKITTDPKWQGKRIVVSGHNVPGEGEHKIMDFIRAERAGKDYDPNTRHCMYGLDADLMMLGICSHEPHFSLLREEVKFGRMPQKPHAKKGEKAVVKKDPKRCAPDQITFHLLHLSLMREYLYWEFHDLKDKLSFPYDQERIADDWILMCFLVGNDFIPHLPHVHIHDDGLPFLYDAYKRVLPTLDGYINESGWLNLKRFEVFLKAVADNDKDHFMKIIEDKSFLESKRTEGQQPSGSRPGLYDALDEQLEAFNDSDMSSCTDDEDEDHESDTESGDAAFVSSDEEDEIESTQKSSSETDIQSAADALASLDVEDPADSEFAREMALREFAPMDEKDFESSVAACWSRTIGNSFKRHKKEYYKEKLKYGNISKDQLRGQSEGYVRAIQWVLHYYYHGCVSWNWFFQHHYAPYISDVTDFSGMTMDFELSKPFHPFEQLLAVLPAASSDCLPPALRELMCDKNSPIADFYPMDFKTDLNGKKNDWEAVVLIPFIQESRLLEAIKSKEPMMTAEEKKRNEHGQHVLWTSETDKDGKAKPKPTLLSMDIYHIPKEKVVWGLLPNVKLDVYFPGFPTMKHLPHIGQLRCVNVSVFQQASKKHSMVLSIDERPDQQADLNTVATDLIGKEVCVEWPVLKIGMVDHVISQTHRYSAEKDGSITVEELDPDQKKIAATKLRELKDRQMSRFAIDCNSSQAIVYVRRFLGVNYEAVDGTLIPRKQYGGVEDAMAVPINLVVTNITVEQGRRLQEIPVEQAYPPNSRVFVMAPSVQAFGYPCLVDAIEDPNKASCRVRIKCALTAQPDLTPIRNDIQAHSLRWYDGYGACKQVNISNRLMGRITGTIFLVEGKSGNHDTPHHHHGVKYNIGLNLKLTKKNLEVPDFSRRTKSGIWQYSLLAVNCLADYKKRFPEIFKCLEQSTSYDDIYYSGDIWENEDRHERRLTELRDYLAALPSAQIEKQDAGSMTADCMLLSHLEMLLQNTKAKTTMFKGSVTPNLIWRPDLYDGKVRPDPEADFQLLDRVVNTAHGQVPFGQLGTVISVMADKIEVLFDKEFQGGYKKKNLASCARVPIASLINITFGKERKGKPKMEMEERPSTSRAPGRLAAGRDAPRQSDWYKKGAKKEAPYTEHPILKKLLAEPGSMKILSRNQEDGRTDTSSAPPKETKPVKMLIKRQETVEEKNKAVESRIHDMLGLNLDKKAMKEEKKKTEREEIEAAVKDIMKDVGNQPEEKKKEPLPGKWDPNKDNKSHPKETVFTNSSVKAVQREPTVITASTPNIMPVKTVLPTRAAVSAAGPATTTLIPTSNMDRMHLTDLKPSTILKRGGPVNNRSGGRHPGGRGVPPPQKTPQPVPMPITQPFSSSTSSSSTGNGRKQKKCRLAATFPTS